MKPGCSDRAARLLTATRLHWNHRLKHLRTGGKLIQIVMTTTPTPLRLAVHFSGPIIPNGSTSKKKHTQSTPISAMWHATYFVLYHMLSEWSPVFPLGETLSDGGSRKLQAKPFTKKSLSGSMHKPITGHWQAIILYWIRTKLK